MKGGNVFLFKKKYFKFNVFLSFFLLFICLISSSIVYAKDDIYVIPGGDAIGLKLDTGVYVAGKFQVSTKNTKLTPWKNSDIEEGDHIISCNGITVMKTADLNRLIQNTENNMATLEIQRNSECFTTEIDVVKTINGEQTIGLYVKDRLIGIGTLTFIDPENKTFASLGHGISDKSLNFGSVSGELVLSKIEGIKKGIPGTSGEKRASISSGNIGSISINSITGVYGKINTIDKRKTIRVATQSEIKKGSAKILTVIDGDKIESFNIEVIGINHQDSRGVKGIKIKVTDQRLIDVAGGIVQGMSGSPIIQNNMIIGAVSHVSLEDPTIGYGMHIEWMINESKKL